MTLVASELIRWEQFSEMPFYSVDQFQIDNDFKIYEDSANYWDNNDFDGSAHSWHVSQSMRLIYWLYLISTEFEFSIDIPSLHPSAEFFLVLSGKLLPLGFANSDMYIDSYQGHIVDYFRKNERITCIVSAEDIQILTYLRGEFNEEIFSRTKQGKDEISEYLNGLCKKLEV